MIFFKFSMFSAESGSLPGRQAGASGGQSFNRRAQTGQLMVEALIALGIISIGVVSVLVMINVSFVQLSYAPNRYLAANLAAEGIEIVKNMVDSNILKKAARENPLSVNWDDGIDNGSYEADYDDFVLTFLSDPADPRILRINADGLYNYNPVNPENPESNFSFTRQIDITHIDSDAIYVTSTVRWIERGSNFEVDVGYLIYNWAFFLPS